MAVPETHGDHEILTLVTAALKCTRYKKCPLTDEGWDERVPAVLVHWHPLCMFKLIT
jgi:hypothetical protein